MDIKRVVFSRLISGHISNLRAKLRTKHPKLVVKSQTLTDGNQTETGIELHGPVLTDARTVAHRPFPSAGRTLYVPAFAGTINVSA
jgi:hypothetical protein